MDIFKLVVISSGIASVLALMILALKTLYKNRLGVKWNYYIWLLLLLRLIIPPNMMESSLCVYNALPMHNEVNMISKELPSYTYAVPKSMEQVNLSVVDDTSINTKIHTSDDHQVNIATPISKSDTSFKVNTFNILFAIWILGMIILTTYISLINYNLNKRIRQNKHPIDDYIVELFHRCMKTMNIEKVDFIISDQIESPAVLGIINHRLVIPKKHVDTLSIQELKHIILHELSHIKKHDLSIRWIMNLLQIIHWFNPIIWYSFYRMDQDCELACDATALSYLDADEHKDYGYTLIRLVELISEPRWMPTTMCIINGDSNIKRRIEMINIFKKGTWKWSIIGVAIFAAIGIITLTSPKSEPVDLNNPVIEDSVRVSLEKPEGEITRDDLLSITELIIRDNKGIPLTDLSGIEYLTNLTILEIDSDTIADIEPLSNLTNLKQLMLYCNNLDNIDALSGLNSLQRLSIVDYKDSRLDNIDAVSNLTHLKSLTINGSMINDLSAISGLVNLETLCLEQTINLENEDLYSIKGLTKLKNLSITDTYISDVSFVKNHPNLVYLNLMCNQVTDINELTYLKSIEHIVLSGNQISDISALSKLTTINDLEISSNAIVDLQPLAGLTSLKRLFISDNYITDVNALSQLTGIELLDIKDNQIKSLKALDNLVNCNIDI